MDTHATPSCTFRCELCSGTRFLSLYLPDGTTSTGLVVCRDCRLVYAPMPVRPAAPVGGGAPDLARYGPG
jgi:hypothetical protein